MRGSLIFSTVMLLLAAVFIAIMPTEAECAVYADTVRLHILAPSDSAEDQALKLSVRDEVLRNFSGRLSASADADEAITELRELLPELTECCEACVADSGFDYSVSVAVSEEWFETREYGELTLPAGRYASLKIVLGEGEGQNWWCVMFPPLCLDMATDDTLADNYTDEEQALITGGGYRMKFKLLELISSAFS